MHAKHLNRRHIGTFEIDGWRLEHEPYRRFKGPNDETLVPSGRLTDEEAWQKLREHLKKVETGE